MFDVRIRIRGRDGHKFVTASTMLLLPAFEDGRFNWNSQVLVPSEAA